MIEAVKADAAARITAAEEVSCSPDWHRSAGNGSIFHVSEDCELFYLKKAKNCEESSFFVFPEHLIFRKKVDCKSFASCRSHLI